MNLEFKGGLLFTTIELTFSGHRKTIGNVVVDTGAAESIISPDVVEDIGIDAKISDSINSFYGVGGDLHNFFSKKVDSIQIGNAKIKDVKMDFGVIDPSGEVNGLLGLDLLIELEADINLKNYTLMFGKESSI